MKTFFFHLDIIRIVGSVILLIENVDYVFLGSTLNRNFVLLELLSQYLATVIIKGVFRTLLNMLELFVKMGAIIMSLIRL